MEEEVLRPALDRIRTGVVVLDDESVIECNRAARQLLGGERLVGRPFSALPSAIYDLLARTDADDTLDAEIAIGDEPRYLEVELSRLGSDATGGRLLLLRDVTERHRAEDRHRSLLGNLSDVVTVLDADGNVDYLSPSVERVLGYDPDDGLDDRALELIHPDDRDDVRRVFRRCFEDPAYIPHVEYRFRHADGSWIWIESRARNLFDVPSVNGVVVVSRDVTGRKRKEETLRRQNERLEEFASVVSHDLRNPLSVLRGRLALARETGDPEHFDAMDSAVDRMDDLVDDLLALARAGQDVGATEPVSVAEVVRRTWRGIDAPNASLEIVDDVEVEADVTRLQQLMGNVLSNAVEHAGPNAMVRFGRTDGGFYVEDDGPGVPPDERQIVFTRGVSGSPDGTGYGLAIVERIADAHGWDVGIGEGTAGGARLEFSVESPD